MLGIGQNNFFENWLLYTLILNVRCMRLVIEKRYGKQLSFWISTMTETSEVEQIKQRVVYCLTTEYTVDNHE